MGKLHQIIQSYMSLAYDGRDCNLVIVFMNDTEIEAVHIVPLPAWNVVYNPQYEYYQFCNN
jgi:hypothetical protein